MNPEELDAVEAAADPSCDECGVPHAPTDAHGDEAAESCEHGQPLNAACSPCEVELARSYSIQQQEMDFELGGDYGRVMGWYDEPYEPEDDWLEADYEERYEEEDY